MWTIHKFIVLDCANVEYIGITEDEATDKSSTEQESICLRFVDESYNEPRVREEIVGLVKADSMKTEVSDIVWRLKYLISFVHVLQYFLKQVPQKCSPSVK